MECTCALLSSYLNYRFPRTHQRCLSTIKPMFLRKCLQSTLMDLASQRTPFWNAGCKLFVKLLAGAWLFFSSFVGCSRTRCDLYNLLVAFHYQCLTSCLSQSEWPGLHRSQTERTCLASFWQECVLVETRQVYPYWGCSCITALLTYSSPYGHSLYLLAPELQAYSTPSPFRWNLLSCSRRQRTHKSLLYYQTDLLCLLYT